MLPPRSLPNRRCRFSASASRPTFPPGGASCSTRRTISTSPRIGHCLPERRSSSRCSPSTSSATDCATRSIPAPDRHSRQTVGGQELAPAGEPRVVDLLAITQQLQQSSVDLQGGAAGQGEPAYLLRSVDPAA